MKKFGFNLAESAVHAGVYDKIHRYAFTLAEVLITLAIIGIVAAISIPMLINNYKKKIYVVGLEKGYAQMQNAFKLMMATEGVDNLQNTEMFSEIYPNNGNAANWLDYRLKAINNHLRKYINLTKVCSRTSDCFPEWGYPIFVFDIGNKEVDGLTGKIPDYLYPCIDNAWSCIQLADGMIVELSFLPTPQRPCKTANCTIATFDIDINGIQKPNLPGRDIFRFSIYNSGAVIPYGTKNPYWKDVLCAPEKGESSSESMDIDGDGQDDTITYTNFESNWSCAARVLETRKMDY